MAFGGDLFVADDKGHISRLPAASMTQGARQVTQENWYVVVIVVPPGLGESSRTDGLQLYATQLDGKISRIRIFVMSSPHRCPVRGGIWPMTGRQHLSPA